MPAARYWRLVGCKPYGYAADLSLSEIALYADATRVDTGLTCSYTPSSGSLSNLTDGSTSSVCTFAPSSFNKSNFALAWDLGSVQDVTSIRIGSAADKSTFLAEGLLQASTDGVRWIGVSRMQGITYPGAGALTEVSKFKVRSPDFLARFEGVNGAQVVSNEYGSAPTFTFSSGVALSTAQSYAGSSSMYFPGTDRFLYSASQPHAASFNSSSQHSMSAWVYYDATSYISDSMVIGAAWETYSSSAFQEGWYLEVSQTGRLNLSLAFNSAFPGSPGTFLQSPEGVVVPLQTWTHVAWDRHQDTIWLYLNGQVVATANILSPQLFQGLATRNFGIGCINTNLVNSPWKGYIDEYMLLNGAAVFGGMPFTPGPWQDQVGDSPSSYAATPDLLIESLSFDKVLFANPTASTQVESIEQPARLDVYFGGNGVINGTVKEKSEPSNVPLYRRVRLLDQRSGYVVAETWSNATTGAYSFANIDRSRKYTVVSYDHTGFYRAVIADNLTPDLMS